MEGEGGRGGEKKTGGGREERRGREQSEKRRGRERESLRRESVRVKGTTLTHLHSGGNPGFAFTLGLWQKARVIWRSDEPRIPSQESGIIWNQYRCRLNHGGWPRRERCYPRQPQCKCCTIMNRNDSVNLLLLAPAASSGAWRSRSISAVAGAAQIAEVSGS